MTIWHKLAPLALLLLLVACGGAAVTGEPAGQAPRAALEATDPATFQLAAGRPQLIEFFAFW